MKDEAEGNQLTEFVWLKSNMYSYIKNDTTGDKNQKKSIKTIINSILK